MLNFVEPFLNGRAGDVNVTTGGGEIYHRRQRAATTASSPRATARSPRSICRCDGGNVTVDNRSHLVNGAWYGNGIYAHSWATYSGLGGNVNVTSNANIETAGLSQAHAIWALSEGGYWCQWRQRLERQQRCSGR